MDDLAWCRDLARSLVGSTDADDVAQDVWIATAEHPPPADRPHRPWLSRVVRNAVRMRSRGARRRLARELAIEPPDAPETPTEIAARVETNRMLAGLVLELPEHQREVVLLHFVEDLKLVDVAARLGIPSATARTRLHHALAALRDRLAARDRKAWLAGVITMKKPATAILVAILLALVAIAIVIIVRVRTREPAGTPIATPRPSDPAATTHRTLPSWLARVDGPPQPIAGRVVAQGTNAPVAGATVALHVAAQPDAILAEVATTADGAFAFGDRPAAAYQIVASAADRSVAIVDVDTEDPAAHANALVLALGDCSNKAVGRVEDAEHIAIAHARVRIAGLAGVATDATGHYELCRPPGTIVVTAGAAGYGTLATTFAVPGVEHRDFVLVPEAILVGRVVLAGDGSPVADATVLVVPADRARAMPPSSPALAPSSATTDADGRFQIDALAPGRVLVSVVAAGLGGAMRETDVAPGASKEITIPVEPRLRIRGRVSSDGTPIGGVRVVGTGAEPLQPVWSRADGTFAIDGASPGQVLRWQVAGYDVRAPESTTIGATASDVAIEVVRGATIRGRVTERGAAVAGADVAWMQGDRSLQTKTTDDGAYELAVSPGAASVIASVPATYHYANPRAVDVAAGGTATVDLAIDQEGSITGTVVDASGAPVPSVYVRFDTVDDYADAMTDERAAFSACCLSGGDYRATVYPTSTASHEPFAAAGGGELPHVHVADARAHVAVRLAIANARAAIRGRVVDGAHAPVADVRVEATSHLVGLPTTSLVSAEPSAVSNGRGAFAIENLAPGTYNLRAHAADGSETIVLAIHTGGDDVEFVLERSGAIDATLAGFGPQPTAIVSDRGVQLRTTAVDGGHVRFAGLRPTTYTLVIQDAAGDDTRSVTVTAGKTTAIELRARPASKIEGRVVDYATSSPIAGATCTAVAAADGYAPLATPRSTATTAADGRFTIGDAPSGTVRVDCRLANAAYATAQRMVDAPAGGATTTELALVPIRSDLRHANPGFNLFVAQLPTTIAGLVPPDGPAFQAGLAVGDEILSIDGVSLDRVGIGGGGVLLTDHPPGTTLALGIRRRGRALTINLTLR